MTVGDMGVRPTLQCLTDIGERFPAVTQELNSLSHPLVEKAQELPAEADAGGLEPILSLKDRPWYKVKVINFRGAATNIEDVCGEERYKDASDASAYWWLCRGGVRQSDSAKDFYKLIPQQAARLVSEKDRRESKRETDTSSWLPDDIDLKRLKLEQTTRFAAEIRQTVVNLIARSMRDGKIWRAEAGDQEITALVRADDGEAYLALGAHGYYDERIIAIMLDAVPGIDASDWMVEPSEVRGIEPSPGQVVFSAIIPHRTQSEMLNVTLPVDWADDE